MAAEEGFEPSQTESESGVLPLHNSAKRKCYYTWNSEFVKLFFKSWRFSAQASAASSLATSVRSALPRWLTAFFCSGESSAEVQPNSGI